MLKFRLYYDKDLFEEWLNEMSEKGWALERFFGGVCFFRPCEPGEYIYRMDMLKSINGQEYKEFMKEMNIEPVQQWFKWITLRKKRADGPFDLYTDDASLIEKYKRIRNFFKFFVILSVVFMAIETFIMIRTGDIFLFVPVLLFGLLIFLFIRQALRCNSKIIKLKGRLADDGDNAKRLPLLLCLGLLINGVNLMTRMYWTDYFSAGTGHNISLVISAIALGMMLIGAFQQMSKLHRI